MLLQRWLSESDIPRTCSASGVPNFFPPINIMRLEYLKEDNLYTGDKPLQFILVPKCRCSEIPLY